MIRLGLRNLRKKEKKVVVSLLIQLPCCLLLIPLNPRAHLFGSLHDLDTANPTCGGIFEKLFQMVVPFPTPVGGHNSLGASFLGT